MRPMMFWAGILVLAGVVPGFAEDVDSAERVVKDIIGFLKDATTTLATIKDEPSASTAQADLKKLHTRDLEIRKRFRKLNLSREQITQLSKKHHDDMDAAQAAYRKEVARVRQVKGGPQALAVLTGAKTASQDGSAQPPKDK